MAAAIAALCEACPPPPAPRACDKCGADVGVVSFDIGGTTWLLCGGRYGCWASVVSAVNRGWDFTCAYWTDLQFPHLAEWAVWWDGGVCFAAWLDPPVFVSITMRPLLTFPHSFVAAAQRDGATARRNMSRTTPALPGAWARSPCFQRH